MKHWKQFLMGLLVLLVLSGCGTPSSAETNDGFVELKEPVLAEDRQLNSLLSAYNRAAGDAFQLSPDLVSPGEVNRQVLVRFPGDSAQARLTINESGLYLVLSGDEAPESLFPIFLSFCQVIQPDLKEHELDEVWQELLSGDHPEYGSLTHGDFDFAAADSPDGWSVKLHHSGRDYLGQKLLFESSCRRRRSPLIPAKPEE